MLLVFAIHQKSVKMNWKKRIEKQLKQIIRRTEGSKDREEVDTKNVKVSHDERTMCHLSSFWQRDQKELFTVKR